MDFTPELGALSLTGTVIREKLGLFFYSPRPPQCKNYASARLVFMDGQVDVNLLTFQESLCNAKLGNKAPDCFAARYYPAGKSLRHNLADLLANQIRLWSARSIRKNC